MIAALLALLALLLASPAAAAAPRAALSGTVDHGFFGASVMGVHPSLAGGARLELRSVGKPVGPTRLIGVAEVDGFVEFVPRSRAVGPATRVLLGLGSTAPIPGGEFRYRVGGSLRVQAMVWSDHAALRFGPGLCHRWSIIDRSGGRPPVTLGWGVCMESLPAVGMLHTYGALLAGFSIGVDLRRPTTSSASNDQDPPP